MKNRLVLLVLVIFASQASAQPQGDSNYYVNEITRLRADLNLVSRNLLGKTREFEDLQRKYDALLKREANGQPDSLDALFDLYGKRFYVVRDTYVVNTMLTNLMYYIEQPLRNPDYSQHYDKPLKPLYVSTQAYYQQVDIGTTWQYLKPGVICEMNVVVDNVLSKQSYLVHAQFSMNPHPYNFLLRLQTHDSNTLKAGKGETIKHSLYYYGVSKDLEIARPITKKQFGEFIKSNKVAIGFRKVSEEEAKLYLDAVVTTRIFPTSDKGTLTEYFMPTYLRNPTNPDFEISRLPRTPISTSMPTTQLKAATQPSK